MAKTIGQLTQATTIGNSDLFVIEQASQTKKVAASVVRGGLVDADVDAAAAIVYSKLDLDDSIVAGDLTADAVTTAKIDDDAVTTAKILDANVTPAKLSQPYTLATAQASTSGTSIDFTGIPSWARRVTVMFNGVSTNGNDAKLIQIGTSGGFQTTSYNSASSFLGATDGHANFTAGIGINFPNSANVMYGNVVLTLQNSSDHTWTAHGTLALSDAAFTGTVAGSKTLSAALTQIRITTTGGTDTFDAGEINISYEG